MCYALEKKLKCNRYGFVCLHLASLAIRNRYDSFLKLLYPHIAFSHMAPQSKSAKTDIPALPVVQATKEDMKCLTSLIHKLKSEFFMDGGVCIAPSPE